MKKSANLGLTKVIVSVVLVLLILLLVNFIPKILRKDVSTILPIDFEYKETLPIQGIIIKNEKLYFSKTNAEVYGIVDEGIRVPVGMEIAQVISLKDLTLYKSELDSIESLINQIDINNSNIEENGNNIVQMKNTLVNQMQTNIQNGVYDNLKNLKENLILTIDNDKLDTEANNSEMISIEQLVDKRNNILKEISNYNESLFSRHSGILSYKMDYFEEVLNASNLDSTSEYIFDSDINIKMNNEPVNKAVFKIIDGHEYYIAIKLSSQNNSVLSEKDNLEIEIMDLDDIRTSLRVPVIKRYIRGTEEIIILKSNEFLEKIYDLRFLDLEIVTFKEGSFKVPLKSITTNKDLEGVFIRSFYDVVVFRPVIINAKDDNFAYLSKGDSDNKVEIEDEFHKTINEFSEIIKNPNLVTEGQILN